MVGLNAKTRALCPCVRSASWHDADVCGRGRELETEEQKDTKIERERERERWIERNKRS
jgi:hypothetical protein